MRVQLEDLLLETDRLKLQLEQKKTQLALVEEKKAENELTMKKEIRALLETYLQLKAQVEESESCEDDRSRLHSQYEQRSVSPMS